MMKNILIILSISAIFQKSPHEIKKYFDDGTLKSVERYIDTIKNGLSEYYFQNGKLAKSFNYINGEREGEYKTYYENGNVYKKGYYKNGKLDGSVITFSIEGDTVMCNVFSLDTTKITILYRDNGKRRTMRDLYRKIYITYDESGKVEAIKKIE